MGNIVKFEPCKKVGDVVVSVYKDLAHNYPFFYIKSDNSSVLPVSYVIEDTLKRY